MSQQARHVLVLGAYGFIGTQVVRALRQEGVAVTGLGRDPAASARVLPDVVVRHGDMRHMQSPEDWHPYLTGIDVVINCAGALQDTASGDLEKLHHGAVAALAAAATSAEVAIVQVSAAGATQEASTEFMRSKARGDAALLASGARVTILRPGLVIGQGAFGGTLLLRMLAAVPVIQPVALPKTPVQSVMIDDVTDAVVAAAIGRLPTGVYDLVEDTPHSLEDVVSATRRWLGFRPPRLILRVPDWILPVAARLADVAGYLGWRSPLRSTAIAVLKDGVTGNPLAYRTATGRSIPPLDQALRSISVGREHRLDARMALMMPVVIATLCLFWFASGLIGVWQVESAAKLLQVAGWSALLSKASVVFWSFVDIALAIAVLYRPWAGRACLAMVAVSLIYLISATIVTPGLWADPLGPMVKVIPGIMLALIAHQMLEAR
ncbi:putative NAD dependent epimerase [Phaeobacter piscinae]|uniref:NAD dependent epimerase n=1 Tax=Phaeobacter piscinae TaxID=1580596 RepID=A0AAD0CHP7_9RHOB|nr:SDR family oxidoreductase [Phaeobacter piscinae]ATG42448.1 putative NAD dependent epimerase [Phaeobacter piscinae]AUR34782.1 putative NAD dependent epimerase [Phaeobacter piscinae]